MNNIEVNYKVVRGGELLLDGCYADVPLTDKNIKEIAEFIKEGHQSGEIVDVPSHVYDRIYNAVVTTAIKDLKSELKETLDDSDEVVLQEVLPADIVNLLPEEVADLIDLDKIQEYYDQFAEDDEEEEDDIAPGLYYNEETNAYDFIGEEEPTKDNTLYLTISQKYFDAIISGKRDIEEREIKGTTYKKYLETDANDEPCFNKYLISPENPLFGDLYIWNDGKYPYSPKESLRYLNLAVGYNKERDTALVELSGFRFKPTPTKNGIIPRFFDDGKNITPDPNGNLCMWCIEMKIKRVVECKRK